MTATTWMTKAEAAEYLRVSPHTIDRYVRESRLPKYEIGGRARPRFRQEDLDSVIAPARTRWSKTPAEVMEEMTEKYVRGRNHPAA